MEGEIEDVLSQMDRISDNNNMRSIQDLNSLINSTSDSKYFSFGCGDIDRIGIQVDMCDRYSNIVSDASIKDNNNRIGI